MAKDSPKQHYQPTCPKLGAAFQFVSVIFGIAGVMQ